MTMSLTKHTVVFAFGSILPLLCSATSALPKEVELWGGDNTYGQCWSGYVHDNFPNKDIEIKISLQPATGMMDASRTALQAGAGPDIVLTNGPSATQELAKAGLVVSLDDTAAKFGWKDRFAPWALDLGKTDGHLYSVPDELETMVMWYNKTLFDKNGWKIPTTMDELFTLADSVQKAGIIPFAPAFSECQACLEWNVGVFMNHYAGPDKVYAALTGQLAWTDPAFVEAITKLNSMMQNKWLMGGADYFFSDTFDTAHAMFGNGEIAMNIEGTWFQSSVNDWVGPTGSNQNEWDWFPIPTTFSKDPFYMIGVGSSWSLNANSKDLESAAEVMNWVFEPETQVAIFQNCSKSPAPLNYSNDVFTKSDPRIARIYSSFSEASKTGNVGYTPWSFWPAKSDVYLYEGMAQVYAGKITVEQYLAELDRIFKVDLENKNVPPIPKRG